MTAPPLLEVSRLHVAYGQVEAVSDVSIAVGAGEIVTVIGRNGAGKTTLLSAIMGILPSRGAVRFAGEDLTRLAIGERVARGLCLVPEHRALFGSMTVADNLALGAFRHGADERRASQDEMFALFPRLAERRSQLAATLSGGERQMLALARALMGRPRLLMLDEPSLGLAPLIVRDVFRIVAELRERGVAILLVEQNARAALTVADRAYVLELGRVALEGPAAELAGDPRIAASYLGIGGRHRDGPPDALNPAPRMSYTASEPPGAGPTATPRPGEDKRP